MNGREGGPTLLLGADTLYFPTCYCCYSSRIERAQHSSEHCAELVATA